MLNSINTSSIETPAERAILVGLITQEQNERKAKEYIEELAFLADTAGAVVVRHFFQHLDYANKKTFVGTGKLEEIQNYIGFELPVTERPVATEVEKSKLAFEAKLKERPKLKMEKRADVNREIMKIYLNGGKKKKLRAIDFVGTILSIDGVEKEDIGIIDIQDNVTYIDILNGKGWTVVDGLKTKTIKGKKLKVQKAYK